MSNAKSQQKIKKGYVSSGKRVNRGFKGNLFVTAVMVFFGAFMFLPMLYSVSSAFKPLEELFIFPPQFLPISPTLNNFKSLFRLTSNLWVPFSRYLFNSAFVSIVVTASSVFVSSMAAYIFAKHKFPGGNAIYQVILLALLFSSATMAIPRYIILAQLKMINTYWAAILPPIAGSLGLFLMRQFMNQMVPDECLESARIDGAKEFSIYWNIVMPLVKPAWLTLIIFGFQDIWNNTASNVIYTEEMKMLPLALNQIQAGGIARMGVGSAATLILMVPPILTFIITQSNIIETMSHSGIKG